MKNLWFEIEDTLKKDGLLYMIHGNRGCGKTLSAQKYVTNRFLNYQEKFIILKRYKSHIHDKEYKQININFWKSLESTNIFEDVEFGVSLPNLHINGEVAGTFLPLSQAYKFKSSDFSEYTTIIFDEYCTDGEYIPHEVEKFLNFADTVIRNRDNLKIVMLGNAISMYNPYTQYLNIKPNPYSEFTYVKKSGIIYQLIRNKDFTEYRKQTKIGRLIDDTDYGNHAINNVNYTDNFNLIEKKNGSLSYYFTIVLESYKVGVWYSNRGIFFVSRDYDKRNKHLFSFSIDVHNTNTILITSMRDSSMTKNLVTAYKRGRVRFEDVPMKNELIKYIF